MRDPKEIRDELIRKSIFSGILVSIAGLLYMKLTYKMYESSIIPSILFTVALYTILVYNGELYTGKVGYLTKCKNNFMCKKVIQVLTINYFTALICGYLFGLASDTNIRYYVTNIYLNKYVGIPFYIWLVRSFGCGFLMFLGSDSYRYRNDKIMPFLCISSFILCGFEHSIANASYTGFMLSSDRFGLSDYNFRRICFDLLVIIGNGLGGNFAYILIKTKEN